ncbi:MAG: hypothetical protein NVSMB21_15490 [Vulcanimicrobiaceae bacterium]
MLAQERPDRPSPETRSTLSLAIVGRTANVVAHTSTFASEWATDERWSPEIRAIAVALIERVERGETTASAVLSAGKRMRVTPLVGLVTTYVVSIERERYGMSAAAIAERFSLSRRESEVVELLMHGATNAEIARELGIGETTAVSHVRNVGLKLGCSKRSTMVARILGYAEPERMTR